jgi:hypothetical protein
MGVIVPVERANANGLTVLLYNPLKRKVWSPVPNIAKGFFPPEPKAGAQKNMS